MTTSAPSVLAATRLAGVVVSLCVGLAGVSARPVHAQELRLTTRVGDKPVATEHANTAGDTTVTSASVQDGMLKIRGRLEMRGAAPSVYDAEVDTPEGTQRVHVDVGADSVRAQFVARGGVHVTQAAARPAGQPVLIYQNFVFSILGPQLRALLAGTPPAVPATSVAAARTVNVWMAERGKFEQWTIEPGQPSTITMVTPAGLRIEAAVASGVLTGFRVPAQHLAVTADTHQ